MSWLIGYVMVYQDGDREAITSQVSEHVGKILLDFS